MKITIDLSVLVKFLILVQFLIYIFDIVLVFFLTNVMLLEPPLFCLHSQWICFTEYFNELTC